MTRLHTRRRSRLGAALVAACLAGTAFAAAAEPAHTVASFHFALIHTRLGRGARAYTPAV